MPCNIDGWKYRRRSASPTCLQSKRGTYRHERDNSFKVLVEMEELKAHDRTHELKYTV